MTENVDIDMAQLMRASLPQSPRDQLEQAKEVATLLADFIRQNKLAINVGRGEHVQVEGWEFLGELRGEIARERPGSVVHTIEDNGIHEYEVFVDLIDKHTGEIVGGASHICRTDEKGWANKPLYAVRSMATTRATGKAFRLKYAWIMKMAGFEPTPAEEMQPDFVEDEKKPRMKNQWENQILDKIMELQLIQARPHAVNILNQSPFVDVPYGDLDMTEAVGYVVLRSQLKEEFPDISSDERMKVANAAWERGDNEEVIAKALELLGEQS